MKYLALAVLAFSVLLLGCTSYSQPTTSPTAQLPTVVKETPTPAAATSTPTIPAETPAPIATDGMPPIPEISETPAPAVQVQEVSISAKRFEFSPSAITLKKGVPAKLKITSTDTAHGFSLPAFGISRELPPNQEVIVEFTPNKAGEFPFSCSVPCGSGHSMMTGRIIVNG